MCDGANKSGASILRSLQRESPRIPPAPIIVFTKLFIYNNLKVVEAAGVEHVGEPEGRSHLPDRGAETSRARRRVVEAAGVEPASESTPSQASTCVAALECSRSTSKSDGNRGSLAPNHLVVTGRSRS